MSYPKFLYHRTEKPVVVNSKEEHAALGKEWKESPADFEEVAEKISPISEAEEKPKKRIKAEK